MEQVHVMTMPEEAAKPFVPEMRDYGTPPDIFGRIYAGSSLKRKNDIRRKRAMKH